MSEDYQLELSDGFRLDITAYGTAAAATPAVIYVHGFKGFKDWGFVPYMGEFLADQGCFCVTFNFSHNGVSSGSTDFDELDKFERNTFSREVRELKELIAAYRAGFFGGDRSAGLAVLGHSRGGAIALLTAATEAAVRAAITWSSVSHLDRYPDKVKEQWRRQGYFEVVNQRTRQVMRLGIDLLNDVEQHANGSLDVRQAVSRLTQPLLIVHGADDESVPADEARELFQRSDQQRSELYLVPGTGHTFGAVHPFAGSNELLDAVLSRSAAFLQSHLA